MADIASSGGISLPLPPAPGAAPGQAGYENGSQSHMPPPLNIPQNNNPMPSAITSAMAATSSISPARGGVRRAAPEPNKRALYVGGLDPRVTEDVLKQIFETTGHVQSVKIIPDKNVSVRPKHVIEARLQSSCLQSPDGSRVNFTHLIASIRNHSRHRNCTIPLKPNADERL